MFFCLVVLFFWEEFFVYCIKVEIIELKILVEVNKFQMSEVFDCVDVGDDVEINDQVLLYFFFVG